MAHTERLGAKVAFVRRLRRDQDRHPVVDFDAQRLQALHLEGIVREKLDTLDAKVIEDGRYHVIRTALVGEAKLEVGVHRVETRVLQTVRRDLVRQADAAPLLLQVNDNPPPRLAEQPHRILELLLAVAPRRTQHLRRHALVMHPHHHVVARHVARDHHRRLVDGAIQSARAVGPQLEVAELRRQLALPHEIQLGFPIPRLAALLVDAGAHMPEHHGLLQPAAAAAAALRRRAPSPRLLVGRRREAHGGGGDIGAPGDGREARRRRREGLALQREAREERGEHERLRHGRSCFNLRGRSRGRAGGLRCGQVMIREGWRR
mmetsp:Transcript_33220/g.87786  ORF Transcript_33220/g.87786 Transcript_33220/m.87786 type:complete len:319 (+) Transcript_33220:1052-2008(+)